MNASILTSRTGRSLRALGGPPRQRDTIGAVVTAVLFAVVLSAAAVNGSAAKSAPVPLLGPQDVANLPSRPADERIQYGKDALQFGELRLPKGKGPFPVAVVIHGGCWLSNFATLKSTAAIADALREAGVATWNIEYRRSDNPGGGWPGTFTDVAAAADHVRILAGRYPLDLERVIAVGHSAGGHLSLWLAARPGLPADSALRRENPLRLRAAVDLGGPANLRDFTTSAVEICGEPVIEKLLGGSPQAVPARYAQASPAELLPIAVPQLLIVGSDDTVMPARARDAYATAVRKLRGVVDVVVIPDAGHFEVIAPTSAAWPLVLQRILQLTAARAPR